MATAYAQNVPQLNARLNALESKHINLEKQVTEHSEKFKGYDDEFARVRSEIKYVPTTWENASMIKVMI